MSPTSLGDRKSTYTRSNSIPIISHLKPLKKIKTPTKDSRKFPTNHGSLQILLDREMISNNSKAPISHLRKSQNISDWVA